MPHVTLVPLTGFRVREDAMRALGMSLPGLRDRAAAIGQLPALGLLTLAGMTPPHWSCSYRDLPAVTPEAVDALTAERPDLVAVSALTASANEAYRLGDVLRQRGIRSVLGGLHATACPDEALLHFDAVCVGEGEPVWHAILADVERGRLAPRYAAERAFDLAAAPVPRFDLLGGRRPRMTIQTQRGCPLACEFCGASRLLGPFREKPAALIREELAAVRRRVGRPVVELADDNTFAGGRDPAPLLEALGEAGALWFTEADWRIGERPDVLRDLARAGCVQVLVGLESFVFRHPGMGPKAAEMARMMDAVRAIQAAGVAVIGCFIVGSDGETPASMDRLAAFLDDAPMADVQLTIETPFPGTPLHRRLSREGRLLGVGWDAYTLFDVAHRPDRVTPGELASGFRDLVAGVFASGPSGRRAAIRRETWRNHPGRGEWAS